MKPRLPLPPLPAGGQRQAARRWAGAMRRWFDTQAQEEPGESGRDADAGIDWPRAIPFILMHVACLGVLWVGVSPVALAVAAFMYAVRMFALTAFYHRYFSHRTFRTSRGAQLAFAVLGASCAQRGPLWWAAHHRNHHRHADTALDLHSPARRGFWWSHMGWFLTRRAFPTDWSRIPDLRAYPELRWLDRYDAAAPVALALLMAGLGALLERAAPALGTSGPQMLVWGFFVSTVVLFHATVTVNSVAHRYGTRRYQTADHSRNNLWLALLTFGEGWHNNHHFYPGSARQGFRAREIDLTWYGLWVLARLGLVWDLKPVPRWVLDRARD